MRELTLPRAGPSLTNYRIIESSRHDCRYYARVLLLLFLVQAGLHLAANRLPRLRL